MLQTSHPKATASQGFFASRIKFLRNPQPAGFWNIIQEIMTLESEIQDARKQAILELLRRRASLPLVLCSHESRSQSDF